ncbi:MAG: methyltransferase domain-containing protein [Candidatus Riflebacteria bacterium]|nr:methyltransferase domain-containing protein [Candidatus Riflebacteria bacterium]
MIRAGLRKGARVLEIGCGTGSMTTWLSQTVGKNGQVIAVDVSEKQIEIARKAAEESQLTNIEFICSTIEEFELSGNLVDLVYSRLLLMHLKDPMRILKKLQSCLRSGGVIACEEPHASSLITTPRNEYIERLNNMFLELGKLQGLDFNIGDKLLPMIKLAGYSGAHGCFVQPVILMAEAIEFVLMSATEVAPFAIKYGLVSEIEAQKMLNELTNSEFDENSFYTFPRQAQIFGYKQ